MYTATVLPIQSFEEVLSSIPGQILDSDTVAFLSAKSFFRLVHANSLDSKQCYQLFPVNSMHASSSDTRNYSLVAIP